VIQNRARVHRHAYKRNRQTLNHGVTGKGIDLLDVLKPNIWKIRERKDRGGLIRALDYQKDPAVRKGAVKALGEAADPALLALSKLGDPGAIGHLSAALDDASWRVRREAVKALGSLGGKGSLEPLVRAIGDPDENVRREAVSALEAMGSRAVAPLAKALQGEAREGRREAASGPSGGSATRAPSRASSPSRRIRIRG